MVQEQEKVKCVERESQKRGRYIPPHLRTSPPLSINLSTSGGPAQHDIASPRSKYALQVRQWRWFMNKITPSKFDKYINKALVLSPYSHDALHAIGDIIVHHAAITPGYSDVYVKYCAALGESVSTCSPAVTEVVNGEVNSGGHHSLRQELLVQTKRKIEGLFSSSCCGDYTAKERLRQFNFLGKLLSCALRLDDGTKRQMLVKKAEEASEHIRGGTSSVCRACLTSSLELFLLSGVDHLLAVEELLSLPLLDLALRGQLSLFLAHDQAPSCSRVTLYHDDYDPIDRVILRKEIMEDPDRGTADR